MTESEETDRVFIEIFVFCPPSAPFRSSVFSASPWKYICEWRHPIERGQFILGRMTRLLTCTLALTLCQTRGKKKGTHILVLFLKKGQRVLQVALNHWHSMVSALALIVSADKAGPLLSPTQCRCSVYSAVNPKCSRSTRQLWAHFSLPLFCFCSWRQWG